MNGIDGAQTKYTRNMKSTHTEGTVFYRTIPSLAREGAIRFSHIIYTSIYAYALLFALRLPRRSRTSPSDVRKRVYSRFTSVPALPLLRFCDPMFDLLSSNKFHIIPLYIERISTTLLALYWRFPWPFRPGRRHVCGRDNVNKWKYCGQKSKLENIR